MPRDGAWIFGVMGCMRKRIKLIDRRLPDYSKGEEIMNMVTHITGGALGIAALVLCVVRAALRGGAVDVVGAVIYGVSLIGLYTMSSVYHGLRPGMGKKVLQVLDHCTIYLLIAGTYTPIALCAIRPGYPAWGWALFGGVWAIAIVAIVFTAIDLKKYAVLSMICYIGMGWCVVLAADPVLKTIPVPGLIWLLAGGIAYTMGAILYGLGRKHRYMHSVFHLFVLAGSILHFVCIFVYII